MIRKPICWIPVVVSYAVLAWFVFFIINPLCYNIYQQPAFLLTADFFWTKVSVPGGLSEYLQTFIDQFTMFRFWGTLFLVAEVLLTAFLTDRYVRKTVGGNAFVSMLTFILPVAIAIVAWTDIKYAFAINMQALLLVAVLNLHQVLAQFSWQKFMTPVLALFLYHACGPVALYTFAVCCIINYALNRENRELVNVIGAVAMSVLWPVLVYKFILPIKPNAAFYDVRPQEMLFTTFDLTYAHYLFFIYLLVAAFLGLVLSRIVDEKKLRTMAFSVLISVVAISVITQHYHDNRPERIGFKMSVAACHKDWNWIVDCIKKKDWLKKVENYERHINFYYDWALAETNQMPDKMFGYPQLLGNEGLFLDRPIATNICYPVSLFYYNMGFVTSALHYAFEAKSTYINSHYLMQMVIDCMIIIGDYPTALKFMQEYDHTMFSGSYVNDRKSFIMGGHNTDINDDFVNAVRKYHPKNDFYISNQQYNVLQMLLSDKNNKIAGQYLASSALLDNDLELFVDLLLQGFCNVEYNNLPRAYQEAVILYRALNKEIKPGIEKYYVQPYIVEQFKVLQQMITNNAKNMKEVVTTKYANTYWKYYFFENPKYTNIGISQKY